MKAIIKTNKGEINLNLFSEAAPATVLNFINLANRGYYNNTIFHRVIEDFMAQGGDPTGTGMGGPGYSFGDEVYNGYLFDKPGYLAMANAGPNSNGSQFFITTVITEWLNNNHTIFGEVVSESDLEKLEKTVFSEVNVDNVYKSLEDVFDAEEKGKENYKQESIKFA